MRIQELATRLGETALALVAARAVLDLVPLDDEALLATHFALVDLYRTLGDLEFGDRPVTDSRIVRDHPHHAFAIEQLAPRSTSRRATGTPRPAISINSCRSHRHPPSARSTVPARQAVLVTSATSIARTTCSCTPRISTRRTSRRCAGCSTTGAPTSGRARRGHDPARQLGIASRSARSARPRCHKRWSPPRSSVTRTSRPRSSPRSARCSGQVTNALVGLAMRAKGGNGRRFEAKSAATAILELGRRGVLDLAKLRAAAANTPIAPDLA